MRRGIVPIIQTGPAAPLSLFDFTSGYAYQDTWEQLDPLIGMRGVDSLSYAAHALTEVWSDPVSLLKHPNKFDDVAWTAGAAGVGVAPTVRKINTSEWAISFDLNGGTTTTDRSNLSQSFTNEGGAVTSLYVSSAITQTVEFYQANKDGVSDPGETLLTVGPTETRLELTNGVTASELGIGLRGGLGMNDTAEIIIRDAQANAGSIALEFQDNNGVAALDNWIKTGDAASLFYLTIRDGMSVYRLDNSSGVAEANTEADGSAVAAVPYTSSVVQSIDGAAFAEVVETVLATVGKGIVITAAAGEVVDFYFPQWCEGQKVFGLKTQGAARYLVRSQAGVGRISEPDIENKCQNYSIAPVDTTGITDGAGVTTTAVDRASLPSALLDALDLEDPDGTVTAMCRSQGSGTVYATGPTGNQNEHFVRGLIWGEAGTAAAVVGLEDNAIAPLSSVEVLEWVGGKGTPLANTDRWSLAVVAGDVYWIANMMHEGNRERSHIPVAGSVRIRAADQPIAATDDLGIDRGRNSNKQTSTQGAAVPSTFPDNWLSNDDGGLVWSVVDVGPEWIEARLSGTATTSNASLFPGQTTDTVAASGQTWFSIVDLALVAGNTDNIDKIDLSTDERTAAGSQTGGTSLDVLALLSDQQRTFAIDRTFNQGTTARASTKLQFTAASGAVDITLRIQCGENTAWALQHSTEIVRRPLTTGTAIEYQQWVDGLTAVDVWDIPTPDVDLAHMHEFYGQTETQNRLRLMSDSSPSDDIAQLRTQKDGVGVVAGNTADITGLHTFQDAYANGDQELWMDGASAGTSTGDMPTDIDTLILGDNPTTAANRDGTQKRIAFYNGRSTSWIGP